jgi:hypothetical protein
MEAKDVAEALLAKMNAVAQIVHGNHQNVHIGAYGSSRFHDGAFAVFPPFE